ncbi:MAG TPA: hypothetical protein VJL29_05315 [Thermoguttaceae bacterium]|nr:hypothetical protein [Thermoguttaceae bacterium]
MSATHEALAGRPRPISASSWDHDGTLEAASPATKLPNPGRLGMFSAREMTAKDDAMLLHVRAGLQFLRESYAHALDLSEDPWEFSVEWSELRRLGLTCNDVRWLIHHRFVQHACEVTSAVDPCRKFVACQSLRLSKRTCLIVTEEGSRLVQHFAETSDARMPAEKKPAVASLFEPGTPASLVPTWDRDRRQLRVNANIVKEFKVPAPNQEIVLAVFEEERWPPKIDDPLPHAPDIDPQRRLHDTINSLNRRQRHRLIHFHADGLGQGVRWEILARHRAPEA